MMMINEHNLIRQNLRVGGELVGRKMDFDLVQYVWLQYVWLVVRILCRGLN